MPEGDSYVRAATRLRPVLEGRRIDVVGGTPSVRRAAGRLVGSTVDGIRTLGKHLLIDVGPLTIHVALGMSGRWAITRRQSGRTVNPHGPGLRLVLATEDHVVRCFAAPTVEVDTMAAIERRIAHIGVDLLAADFDPASAVSRRSLADERPISDLLLDQRIAAGIGNEYKSEVLFLERVHPAVPGTAVSDQTLIALFRRARRLMVPNASSGGARTTTTVHHPGQELWVYGRAGAPCRRCRAPIVEAWIGRPPRITFWCPRCQPEPNSHASFLDDPRDVHATDRGEPGAL